MVRTQNIELEKVGSSGFSYVLVVETLFKYTGCYCTAAVVGVVLIQRDGIPYRLVRGDLNLKNLRLQNVLI